MTEPQAAHTDNGLREDERGALREAVDRDETCDCHEDNDTSHLFAAVERIVRDRRAADRAEIERLRAHSQEVAEAMAEQIDLVAAAEAEECAGCVQWQAHCRRIAGERTAAEKNLRVCSSALQMANERAERWERRYNDVSAALKALEEEEKDGDS